jgi:hypothetical protein
LTGKGCSHGESGKTGSNDEGFFHLASEFSKARHQFLTSQEDTTFNRAQWDI